MDQSLHITADAEFKSESVDGCGLKIRRSTRLYYWPKLRSRRAQMEFTCQFLVWNCDDCVWQAIAIRTQTIKEWFIYQTADCLGIKWMYSVRISRFIGASSAGIIQLCRRPTAFNILVDGAAWFPEYPGDWKILFQSTLAQCSIKISSKLIKILFAPCYFRLLLVPVTSLVSVVCQTVCFVSNCKND